jgi:membrane protease YdiL (CAAX protease family)
MENESKPPDGEVPARFHFHLALVSVFLPVMWPMAAALAFFFKDPGPPTALKRKWKRNLLALLAADLVVFVCYGWMIAHPEQLERPPKDSERPRIGVVWDADPANVEARVKSVLPGSPADKAGFRAGDLFEKIDGETVSNRTEVGDAIQAGAAGAERTVTVRRDGAPLDLRVTPQPAARLVERKLFEAQKTEASSDWAATALAFLPSLILVGIAAAVSRRKHRVPVVTWRGFLVAAFGSFAVALGTAVLVRALQGGSSRGGMLIMLFAQMAALVGLTRLATFWCGREVPPPADPPEPLPPLRATFLGIYYLLTGVARISIVLWTLDQILLQGSTAAKTQGLEVLATSGLGVWGTVFFLFVVAVLGPFAEESLFRGFLVPRLAAMWSSRASMVVSSILFALFHPHYGLFMPIVFLYGFVFAWARLRTGSILVPFILHFAVNGLVSAVTLLR